MLRQKKNGRGHIPHPLMQQQEFSPEDHFKKSKGLNKLLDLIKVGIHVALLSNDTHRGEDSEGDDEGSAEDRKIADLLHDGSIENEYKEAAMSFAVRAYRSNNCFAFYDERCHL